jgi:UDP-N-acetylmuramoylalanine--D-glutamate ligase
VRFSELEGARVGVWGAGREVTSFAAQAARRLPGARIAVAAFDSTPDAVALSALAPFAPLVLDAADAVAGLAGCEVIVRSPGVSVYRRELVELRERGLHVTTPTSLWLCEHGAERVVGVTGTKGKSTTAALLAQLARAAGLSVELAGNIGVPALDLLDSPEPQLTVLELSSYQLADLACGPEVALVTNVYREHTEWHGSEQAYRADKLRILGLPGLRAAVLNGRDEALVAARAEVPVTLFGVDGGWNVDGDRLVRAGEPRAEISQLPLKGVHNALNLCGALATLETAGISVADPAAALSGFRPLAHRLEELTSDGPALWVNDSISTTPESAVAALESYADRPLVLIAGGQDRGQDYDVLAGAVARAGAQLIGVPSTGPRLLEAARAAGVEPSHIHHCEDLADAVRTASGLAGEGAVVLLSPAAPSYDRFRDFEERGETFRRLVGEAGGKAASR